MFRRIATSPKVLLAILACASLALGQEKKPAASADGKVSYDKQIRPLFQAHCHGCHQPAKQKGNYVMTSYDRLLAGGESKNKAIVPGQPDKSNLVAVLIPDKSGEAEMPKGQKPLHATEVELIRKWIAQGALDDTPANARARYDTDHPPVYTRPPVIASVDFSPDGHLLAVAGFHEVILVKADGSDRVARLVGLSERIQSVRFSPDGKLLAATGGLPGRTGEVQVWDVEKKKLALSVPVTYDTVYGASWSPDGTKIAFGCGDNSIRAVDAKSGEQILYNAAHSDWVLDSVFSADGSHVVAPGRDGTVKLIEVATQRFVDNISSITPGALKGGITAVARHPKRDEIVIGGSDGQPKVYRMHRLVQRRIGDDSNIIRELPAMSGRIWDVAVSADGKRIAAASGLDGKGEVRVYSYEFDTALPDNIKAIMAKVADSRGPQEREAIEKYKVEGVKQISQLKVDAGIVYSVSFRPDGAQLAAAGSDGKVRLINPETGAVEKEFEPAAVDKAAAAAPLPFAAPLQKTEAPPAESLPEGAVVASLEVLPRDVRLSNAFDYAQLVVTARLESGQAVDVTRLAKASAPDFLEVTSGGLVRPKADGQGALKFALGGREASVPVAAAGTKAEFHADFIRDVNPVLSRVGCNAGTCHGAAKGKNGFKLSLRGYDAVLDVRALTDDLASRRTTVASPDDSLMLLKPTGAVPHEGGQLIQPGDAYYRILRTWIAQGARLEPSSRAAKIEIFPSNPIIERIGARQQMRVMATYADGRTRDVTREAYVESGNTEVAPAERGGLLTAIRRGEAAVLARYEGNYAATTLTVMGDRSGFAWQQPPAHNRIDELVADKWKRLKIKPSDLSTDAEFVRRVVLDLTGLPPSADDVRAFLADARETRVKRDELVDKLVGSDPYVEHWTNKWADLLQVNRKFLGAEGAAAFRMWIRGEVAKNTPYNEFVKKIVSASGSNKENPAASYYKILRDPAATAENTTHLFLAVRFNCTKCHDHPFERWTQNQYYETAAYFARVGLKADPSSAGKNIGGTAVEGAKPLYEIVYEKDSGEVKHDRTGVETAPRFPYDCKYEAAEKATRRDQLAAWITSPDNSYFARSYVNRLWGYLLGVGIIEPIDDIRAGNPATNPQLLDHLVEEFLKSGFDTRHLVKHIVKSRTYQLSVAANEWNRDDRVNYSHATARRLPAEVLFDSVHAVTGSVSKVPGVPAGTRAAALPDSGIELPSGFLATFGRPARESACECERTSELRLGAVMALISGPTIADAIADPQNEITKLVAREKDDPKLVDEIFMRVLNRPARPEEVKAALEDFKAVDEDHARLSTDLKKRDEEWAVLLPKLEKEREAAMAKAKAELEAHQAAIAPRVAQEEKNRVERLAKAEAALKAYDETLASRAVEWEKKQKPSGDWVPLAPSTITASQGANLRVEPDLSVVALGPNGKGTYTFTAETRLSGITAVRLEAIADEKFPSRGPGRAPDGNFVLTEFELKTAAKDKPKEQVNAAFTNALADFSQANFDVKAAIDGRPNGSKGWAVSPATGVTHWAVFELGNPVGQAEGTVLTFILHHTFTGADYMLERFRISVTTAPKPAVLGLADEFRAVLATPAAQRNDKQKQGVEKYFRAIDADYRGKANEVAEAKKPLPIDPKLKELQDGLAEVSRPVPLDPKLAQLRLDMEASSKQVQDKRLTVAQDLAWALINSPAFLFNR